MAKHILIVEDHALVRRTVCTLFERKGFEVSGANNGAEGLVRAQQVHPDLIVLDLAMPVMNGFEAARALKRSMPKVPLLLFTYSEGKVLEQAARDAGIAAVVSKSECVDELLVQADALLG